MLLKEEVSPRTTQIILAREPMAPFFIVDYQLGC